MVFVFLAVHVCLAVSSWKNMADRNQFTERLVDFAFRLFSIITFDITMLCWYISCQMSSAGYAFASSNNLRDFIKIYKLNFPVNYGEWILIFTIK